LYNLDDRAAATDAWKRSLALAPDDVDTLLNLGMVEAEIGNTEAARAALSRFLEIAPGAAYETKRRQAQALLSDLPG
ncbi:MAG: tetratricopeptide repeat protein, partial [Acidobacteriota bacterium]